MDYTCVRRQGPRTVHNISTHNKKYDKRIYNIVLQTSIGHKGFSPLWVFDLVLRDKTGSKMVIFVVLSTTIPQNEYSYVFL